MNISHAVDVFSRAITRIIGNSHSPVSVAPSLGDRRRLRANLVVVAESPVDDAHLYATAIEAKSVPYRHSVLRRGIASSGRGRRRLDFESGAVCGSGLGGRRFDGICAGAKSVSQGSAPADYVAVPPRSVYEVRVGGCVHVRRSHGNGHRRVLRQRKAVVARVPVQSIYGIAPPAFHPRPWAVPVQSLRAGNRSQILIRAECQSRCADCEIEASLDCSPARCRRLDRVLAWLERAHYLRVAAIASIVIRSDYRSTLVTPPHQIQVCVRIGRGQVDGHDGVRRQREAVVSSVSARTVLRGAFVRPAPGLRCGRRQRTQIFDARIRHRLIEPWLDHRLDPNHVRLRGRLPQQAHRHIRFQIRLP